MATLIVYVVLLTLLVPPVGAYMYRVYTSREDRPDRRVRSTASIGVDPTVEQTWRRYASCVLWFSGIGMVLGYVLMRLQAHLPVEPGGAAAP